MAKEEGRKSEDGFIKSKMRFQETWLRLQRNQDEKKKKQRPNKRCHYITTIALNNGSFTGVQE